MPFAQIAEKLGISVVDVQDELFLARMQIREYKAYLQARESDERKVEFSLTYQELKEIFLALRQQEKRLLREGMRSGVHKDPTKEPVFRHRVFLIRMLAARAGVAVLDNIRPDDDITDLLEED